MPLMRAPQSTDGSGPTRAVVLLVDPQPAERRALAERLARVRADPRCASVMVLLLAGVSLAAAEAQLWAALDGAVPEARGWRAGGSRSG